VRNPGGCGRDPIRLLYVTPEKVVKSGVLRALFSQLAREGRLARVVIDEAHCVSQVCACVRVRVCGRCGAGDQCFPISHALTVASCLLPLAVLLSDRCCCCCSF
jgi:hypothetical protein